MKIKLHTKGGFWDDSKQVVIESTNIDSMIESDNGGTEILLTDNRKFEVKETIDEIIKASQPAAPVPTVPPIVPTPATE
jgi:hypothetical protein